MTDINHHEARKFTNYEFLARQLVEGFITGLHKSPYHGFSVEFAEHRLYNTGESTRHIDWKVFAKTDRLYTKRYEEETNLRCSIVLDNSSSMRYPAKNIGKIKFALEATAALIYLLQKQRDAVGLIAFSEDIDVQTPVKSTSSHAHSLFLILNEILATENEQSQTYLPTVLHKVADNVGRRSLVIVLTDMFSKEGDREDIFQALQHLKHNKHEVLIFHIHDQATEHEFDFTDRPHQFVDLETGEKLKLNPAEIKRQYQKLHQEFLADVRMRCNQYKIDFVEADIQHGVNDILNAYLIKRKRMT